MLNVTSKVKNKITGCLSDSQEMLLTMHVNVKDITSAPFK